MKRPAKSNPEAISNAFPVFKARDFSHVPRTQMAKDTQKHNYDESKVKTLSSIEMLEPAERRLVSSNN